MFISTMYIFLQEICSNIRYFACI